MSRNTGVKLISKNQAIAMIVSQFPELQEAIKEDSGLLHLQIGTFAQFTQDIINKGNKQEYAKICKLVVDLLQRTKDPTNNALYVSFLEHLNFEDTKKNQRSWALKATPRVMKSAYLDIMNYNSNL